MTGMKVIWSVLGLAGVGAIVGTVLMESYGGYDLGLGAVIGAMLGAGAAVYICAHYK